ncbi:MAG: MATE family efflux transporter [Clostridiaceae bacterium]|nr:MATE family efflux transporter [Clostridiaceae bacterium]
MKENRGRLMTEGPIARQIIAFALPLLLGNIFQQLYNTVDSMVVGNYIGKEALAAVGSSGSLINLVISAFMGLSIGASVVISQSFGAGKEEEVSDAVHTTVAFGLLGGLAVTLLGVLLSPQILRWMGTPENVMPESLAYFRVYFGGVMSLVMYNVFGAILRAVGDSRRPLYFLIVSTLLNIALDLLFVAVFSWGVTGVALATVIAQGVSALLELWVLCRSEGAFRVVLRKVRLHRDILRRILRIGLPSALQNSVVSISNVVVQANINAFGDLAMAGCGAYNKIDGFAIMPAMSFSMAVTTFVGQNRGAGQFDRIQKAARFTVLTSMIVTQTIGFGVWFFAPQLIGLFNSDPQVIAFGALMAKWIAPFYFMLAGTHTQAGALRGVGLTRVPMLVFLTFWCGLRMLWILTMVHVIPDIRVVFLGYPITWTCSAIVLWIYQKKRDWVHSGDQPEKTADAS